MNNDALIILDGCTFFYSDANADVAANDGQGLFYKDVRHLSCWQVRVDDRKLEELTSRRVDYYSARVVCRKEATTDDRPTVTIRRDRFVSEGVHEDIVLENLTPESQDIRLELSYGSDFADVMEAQNGGNGDGVHWQEPGPRTVALWSDRNGYTRGTVLTFSRKGHV